MVDPAHSFSTTDRPSVATTLGAWRSSAARLAPGTLLAFTIAMAAMFVNEHAGGPVMLYALLFGIAFNTLSGDDRFGPGIAFTAKQVLRIGVALLGARITLGEIADLGVPTALLVISGVAVAISLGWVIGRSLGLRSDHAVLSAGAVAICGASAALAISAVLPKHANSERNTILTVVGVTALSTVAMIAYPFIAGALDLSDRAAGVFIGATIHDVAQVVGAGYMISDTAGETATVVKLLRVACLVPLVMILALLFGRQARTGEAAATPLLPAFLIGFVALVALNSTGIVPPMVTGGLGEASRWALVAAVAALGMKTCLKDLFTVGPKPIAVLGLQTVFLAGFALAGLFLFVSL